MSDPAAAGGLTGKERRALRAEGQRMPVSAQIGKQGLSESAVSNVEQFLARRGLVKVRLPGDNRERKAIAEELAERLVAEVVGGTGKVVLLWRKPNEASAKSP